MANELSRLSSYYDRKSARDMDYRGYMEKQAMVKDIGTAVQRGTDQQMIMTSLVGSNITNRIDQSTDRLENSMVRMQTGIQTSIKAQTLTIVASQMALAHTFNQGFDRLNNTLDMGFAGVTNQLGSMTAAFNMGFANVERKIEKMNIDICARLDALHDIMNNPLLTQSRELYRRAVVNNNKGFYEEALEDIIQAVEKNKTDYISWFIMGKIYAFGVGEFSNVIDLEKAINAYSQAAKYNSPDINESTDAKLLAAEIYFYLGIAQYSQCNEFLRNKKKPEAIEILGKALKSFEKSFNYSNNMLEAAYNIARCNAIIGNTAVAIQHLENIIKKNRDYAIKVFDDSDFEPISGQIEALIIKMKNDIYREAKIEYDKINDQLVEINNLKGTLTNDQMNFLSKNLPSEFNENLPYFDIMDSYVIFKTIVPELQQRLKEIEQEKEEEEEEKRVAGIAKAKQERRLAEERAKKEADEREAKQKQHMEVKQKVFVAAICVPVSFIFFLLIFVFRNISVVWGSVIVLTIIAEVGFFFTTFNKGRDTGGIVARIFGFPIAGAVLGLIIGFVAWLLSFISMTFVSILWAIVMLIVDITVIFGLDELID